MITIGINGSLNPVHENLLNIGEDSFHDAAVALIKDGEIIAAFEEERLNRIKHSNKLPVLALAANLKSQGLSPDNVDYFTFGISEKSLSEILAGVFANNGQTPPDPVVFLKQFLEDLLKTEIDAARIKMYDHHFAHAATAFYPSGFNDALVLTIDGFGGEFSGSIYQGKGNQLHLLKTFSIEQSLGNFYFAVTHILGFEHFDEYKVMGLAAYGDPATYRGLFSEFYNLLPDGDYSLVNYKSLDALIKVCPARTRHSDVTQAHMDIAASLQEMLENIVFHMLKHFQAVTGDTNLCMAGGVALNCTLNGKILASGLFKDVFVFPGANDSGIPVGSALLAYYEHNPEAPKIPFTNPYLGTFIGHSNDILGRLESWKQFISYEKLDNPSQTAAQLIADDKVIGWVQGCAEFAPRALGNRSIIADSRPAKNRERINAIIKKREDFRPFAPSILEEYADEYFELPDGQKKYPFMIFLLMVKEQYKNVLGAVTHVNRTARVQTVSKDTNPAYWSLIDHFRQITGTPVVLNTSFNNNAEPIVDTVDDSIVCFLTTHLDFLIVGDYMVKRRQPDFSFVDQLHVEIPPYIKLNAQRKVGSSQVNSFEISNTFNDKKTRVSEKLFKILSMPEKPGPVSELLLLSGVNDTSDREDILKELVELWHKRIVVLRPAKAKQAIFANTEAPVI